MKTMKTMKTRKQKTIRELTLRFPVSLLADGRLSDDEKILVLLVKQIQNESPVAVSITNLTLAMMMGVSPGRLSTKLAHVIRCGWIVVVSNNGRERVLQASW